ncbi:MAG: VOC family protein [Janthinobacterium lividum]
MIDHASLTVVNFERSKLFYQQALAAIEYQLIEAFSRSGSGAPDAAMFGEAGVPDFVIRTGSIARPPGHVAFRVVSREMVRAFHKAALAAGATDHGAPGLREHYAPDYYAAFVLDPDGYNIEAVCHGK